MPWFQRLTKAAESRRQCRWCSSRSDRDAAVHAGRAEDRSRGAAGARPRAAVGQEPQRRRRASGRPTRATCSRSRAATRPEFTEAQQPAQRPRGEGPAPQPSIAQQGTNGAERQASADAGADQTPATCRRDQLDAAAASSRSSRARHAGPHDARRRRAGRGAAEPESLRPEPAVREPERQGRVRAVRSSSTPRASSSGRGFAASSRR